MIAEIISIGTELILGDVVDTNATYLAEKLTAAGFDIHYFSTVGDNQARLVTTLEQAFSRADLIITTGGLGPTEDDLTREAIAEVTGRKLKVVPSLLEEIKNYFQQKNYRMTDNNFKQAKLPEGAEPINNNWGTAPGILLKNRGITLISLPGVPGEMKKMFEQEVFPILYQLNNQLIRSKVIHFFGIGESTLETEIIDLLKKQSNPTIAFLAGKGEVKIRLTAKGSSAEQVDLLINDVEEKIRKKVGKYIYGTDQESLPVVAGKYLKANRMTLGLAESCTGGLVGDRITNVPGSSSYFKGGLMAYSNQVKQEMLGVKQETLKKYGAVSRETAEKMAEGVRNRLKTDLGLSITGIAGPDGGSEDKPVGLIYIGLASQEGTKVYQLNLKYDRLRNKWMSSQYALFYLYRYLKKCYEEVEK